MPANKNINRSKSNRLPDNKYLGAFIKSQQLGIETVYKQKPNHKVFNDYAVFGISIPEIISLSQEKLYTLYSDQIMPQIHIAKQLGFQCWEPGIKI